MPKMSATGVDLLPEINKENYAGRNLTLQDTVGNVLFEWGTGEYFPGGSFRSTHFTNRTLNAIGGADIVEWSGFSGFSVLADLTFSADGTKDIGRTGVLRPRDLNLSRDAIIGNNATVTGTITNSTLTASRAVVSDGSKTLISSATTLAELAFVSGVTSAIQTQLGTKLTGTRGMVAIGNATESGSVTGLGLASTPAAVCLTVEAPAGTQMLFAQLVGAPTTGGFAWQLSAPTDTTTYRLHWIVIL